MTEVKNKTTNIYTEWRPLIDALSNEDAGKLLKDILKYQSNEDVDNNNPVWIFIKFKIDEYNNKGKQISEKRKEIGKKGGLAKASKCYQKLANDSKSSNKIKENKIKENNIYTIQDDLQLDNQDENQVDNKKINKKEYSEDFELFWSLYPKQRRGNKDKANNAYCRVLKDNRCTKEKLLESVKKYSVSKTVKDGYAKGCEAWLNDDRFNWKYEEPTSKAPIGMFGKPIEGYHEW